MPEIPTSEGAPGTWTVPECRFTIEYLPRVLDDIRLAVVDAFFSLPRGGAEIGGILLGRHTEERVTIADYVALDCEHAMGPSFVLSARDESQLEELMRQTEAHPAGLQPVGWYHSHTRTEIFLSDADQQIHKRFFPQEWQVALVFKPHTFQPMRGGFFFREPDGSIHATATYREFLLEAMPLRPIPTGVVPPMPAGTPPMLFREHDGAKPAIDVEAGVMAPKREPPPPTEQAPPIDPPKLLLHEPAVRSWMWPWAVLALSAGLAVGALGFQTRQIWLPKLVGPPRPAAAPAPLTLTAVDANGQLEIRWEHASAPVQQATGAILAIRDGTAVSRDVQLDPEHLKAGSFTYGRESGQVDVALTIAQPNGAPVRAVASFVGQAPPKPVASDANDAQVAKLKSDLAAQVAQTRKVEQILADQSLLVSQAGQMEKGLAAANDKVKKLEKNLADAQAQASAAATLRKDLSAANAQVKKLAKNLADAEAALQQQQRKRMGAQDPGK